jgi:hypothetical protein
LKGREVAKRTFQPGECLANRCRSSWNLLHQDAVVSVTSCPCWPRLTSPENRSFFHQKRLDAASRRSIIGRLPKVSPRFAATAANVSFLYLSDRTQHVQDRPIQH